MVVSFRVKGIMAIRLHAIIQVVTKITLESDLFNHDLLLVHGHKSRKNIFVSVDTVLTNASFWDHTEMCITYAQ